MAALFPFPALRPAPAAAARVAAVPYDVVNSDEARALAADPLSFLHVSRAEIDLSPGTSPYADEVYARAVANFVTLKHSAPLVMDELACLYVYRLRMGAHVQTGIAGAFSIDDYERGAIKKHEHTRRDKEDDRTRHIVELRAQTGPVFLTYRRSPAVDPLVARVTAEPALYDFTAADGVQHTVWRLTADDSRALVEAVAGVEALYIADGHHRAASAARARQTLRAARAGQTLRAAGAAPTGDTFLAVAFPDNQVQVLPYNRVVKDLAGQTPESFLTAVRAACAVADGPAVPRGRGDVSMFLAGHWYTVTLAPSASRDPVDRLDVSRLQHQVLQPLLEIGDVRSDPRIDFVGGARGTSELERWVAAGRAAVAFSLHPVGVDDLMAIADAGGIMPPKSTWFEPKLRDGLLSHVI